MRIPKTNFQAFLYGHFALLPNLPRPSRGRPRESLIARVIPSQLPGLGAEIRSSHSVERTFRHIFLKGTEEVLNNNERLFTAMLSLRVDDVCFLILEKLLQLQQYGQLQRRAFGELVREIVPDVVPVQASDLRSYEPELFLYRLYMLPIQVHRPERKRGHTDFGSLESSPSWKDQILWEENEKDQENLKNLKKVFKRFSRKLPPYPSSP